MNESVIVSSKIISKSQFLSLRAPIWQPHMLPSTLVYLIYFQIKFILLPEMASTETFGWFFFLLAAACHALLFLIPQWSVQWKANW